MTRTLGAQLDTSITLDSGPQIVGFISLEFSSGTIYLTTAAMDIDWGGNTYLALGSILKISGVREVPADVRAQTVRIELSGVDQTIIALALGQNYRGREAKIYYVHIDSDTGAVKTDPLLIFKGVLNHPWVINYLDARDGSLATISTRLTSAVAAMGRLNGFRTNPDSHQDTFSADTFFSLVHKLAGARLGIWGLADRNRDPRFDPTLPENDPNHPDNPGY